MCAPEYRLRPPSEAHGAQVISLLTAVTDRGFSAAQPTMDLREKRISQCYACKEEIAFFKMFRSKRPHHVEWAQKMWGEKEVQILLCVACEKNEREHEVRRWRAAGITFHEDYAEEKTIKKDIKVVSKGDMWFKQAKMMKQAKDEVLQLKVKSQIRLNKMPLMPGAFDGTEVTEEDIKEFVDKGAAKVGISLKDKIEKGLVKKARLSWGPETSVMEVTQMVRDAFLSRKFLMTSMNPFDEELGEYADHGLDSRRGGKT